jgi:hypothetical protein
MKENGMDGTCSMHRRDEETLKGNSGDLDVYKRIILKGILKKWCIDVAKYLRASRTVNTNVG